MARGVSKVTAAKVSLGSTLSPTKAMRVAEAQRLMSQLLPMNVIKAKLMEKFQIVRPTADAIVNAARELWRQEAQAHDPEIALEQYRNAYKMFYNQAMADKNHAPARAALRDLTILDGVNPEVHAAQRTAGALEAGVAAMVDPDAVRARINELVNKRAAALGTTPPADPEKDPT